MSEILDALPMLSIDELQLVHQRILDLEDRYEIEPSAEFSAAIETAIRSSETQPLVDIETVRAKVAVWAGKSI